MLQLIKRHKLSAGDLRPTFGGLAEVELAKLAQQRARNNGVSAFAKQMIDDHGKTNARLTELAKQAGLNLPDERAPDQQEVKQKL